MEFEIVYSDRAKITADQVYDFIEENFGKRPAVNFKTKTGRVLTQISRFPFMFKASELGDDIRIGLITEQTSVLYQVKGDSILLHFFWDNRQEPMF